MSNNITTYLQTLITEKGKDLDSALDIPGHIGLTYRDLIDFIEPMEERHDFIRSTLVKIDFLNGDVFHFLNHLAVGMGKALDSQF